MPNHNGDIKNANKGTPGSNKTYDRAQGNRGKQIQQTRERRGRPARVAAK